MLHPIKIPSCSPALEWIVQLQRDLLARLCDPAATAAIVTPQWVAAIRPDCTAWLEKFAHRTHTEYGLISAMRTIASATQLRSRAHSPTLRPARPFPNLLMRRSNLRQFSPVQSLEGRNNLLPSHHTRGVLSNRAARGLPIDAPGITGRSFDRGQFVEIFEKENYGRVCPLCDGDMNGPEVDHWLPKSKYPALSCHPKNLMPVCHRCNSRECKGEQCPITLQIIVLSTIGFIPTRDLLTPISRLR